MLDIKELLPDIKENVSLAELTTFKIGGLARYFFEANTKQDLIKALNTVKQMDLPFLILGGGSNYLFSKGFDGLVIKIKFSEIKIKKTEIIAQAGAKLSELVNVSLKKHLTGLEWAAGIYGTIGGAIRGNAGAFNGCIANVLKQAEVLIFPELQTEIFNNKECRFFYRESVFKENPNLIVLSAVLELKKGEEERIKKKIEKNLDYRKQNHPLDYPSAGSVFKNPEFNLINKQILKDYPDLKKFSSKKIVPAGFLIEKAGLKGKRIGNARISEKHCNFIVNLKRAKAEDIIKLINLVQEKIRALFGVELEPEIKII